MQQPKRLMPRLLSLQEQRPTILNSPSWGILKQIGSMGDRHGPSQPLMVDLHVALARIFMHGGMLISQRKRNYIVPVRRCTRR